MREQNMSPNIRPSLLGTLGCGRLTCLKGVCENQEEEWCSMLKTPTPSIALQQVWLKTIPDTIFVVCFYVFMEWLFFATKPSFMSSLNTIEKLRVLAGAILPLLLLTFLAVSLLWFSSKILLPFFLHSSCYTMPLIPSTVLAVSFFLLIDNFTYTLFGFGIRTLEKTGSWPYAVLFLVLLSICYLFFIKRSQEAVGSRKPLLICLFIGVFLPGILIVFLAFERSTALPNPALSSPISEPSRKPNIFLVGGDGLNAANMRVYGYARNNTPNITRFAENAVFFENAFANSGHTGASIASMLTAKLPTSTRLIYPPDILRGKNAYQHLPAILKQHGYRNVSVSIRHYADPYDLNMRNSFHWANGRELNESQHLLDLVVSMGLGSGYFIEKMVDRVISRALHILGWRAMDDAFAEVVHVQHLWLKDAQRLDHLFSLIESGDPPFFAHIHLLGTHGPRFRPARKMFSLGKEQDQKWMLEFYDDAIFDFDAHFQKIVDFLEERGIFEDSLVILYSDHGFSFQTHFRVPLIMRFPDRRTARISSNVQNLDIAPTILDYLGISKPEWMQGRSLLSISGHPRPIFAAKKLRALTVEGEHGWEVDLSKTSPPFHSLGEVSMVVCQRWYSLDLALGKILSLDVVGHTEPCPTEKLPSLREARRSILNHLQESGYAVN